MIIFFYSLNVLLLVAGIVGAIRIKSGERNISVALLRYLAGLPLLAGEYIYLAHTFNSQAAQLVLFSEAIFALLLIGLAHRLHNITTPNTNVSHQQYLFFEIPFALAAAYFLAFGSIQTSDSAILFKQYTPEYFSTIFKLSAVLYASWRLEQFWRRLNTAQRWEFKSLVIGCLFISGSLLWSSSYQLTYLHFTHDHYLLLAALLLSGWILVLYGVLRHRLLNRKISISRKVIYSFVIPSILTVYMLGFGLVSIGMNAFGLELSYVLKWLFLVLGCVAIGVFSLSGKIRRRIDFFISTHFYMDKYDYRNEWMSLSLELQGALTERGVISALHHVLSESLYTTRILVWLGDPSRGYRLVDAPDNSDIENDKNTIPANDPLIYFILAYPYFHINDTDPNPAWENVLTKKEIFLRNLNLTLLTPISVGGHLIGLIGLGPEYTGGEYGYDDFDLLTVLGSQTASALMAVRMAEELAHSREQQAWNRLSAFVLHDIKNASTMLSLVKENAPEHIQEPEFQQDMLEVIDDALRRMGRVEKRLLTLKDEIMPHFQRLELNGFLQTCCHRLESKLPSLKINFHSNEEIRVRTDPDLLFSILENLLLNAFEAKKENTIVKITTRKESNIGKGFIEIIDNGPGIAEELLPDVLFEPFKTSKKDGSGIGLWQVKKVLSSLKGSISAKNNPQGGAQFTIKLPL
jgi:putative PEP-CTERM system histidine kinase